MYLSHLHLRLAMLSCVMVGMIPWAGCRRQVYQELYAEQNAREMRALEDRIYEYDSEYRALEQELWALEDENENLRSQLASGSDSTRQSKRKAPALPTPDPMVDRPDWEMPSVLIPDKVPATSQNGAATQKGNNATESSIDDAIHLSPPVVSPAPIVDPSEQDPTSQDPTRQGSGSPPTNREAPAVQVPELRTPGQTVPRSEDRDRDRPMTQAEDARSYRAQSGAAKADPIASIDVTSSPVVPASALQIASPSIQESDVKQKNREQNAQESPIDESERVVELRFHPTLCRGNNFDEDPEDDGVYVVLQPMSEHQSLVSTLGKLTIVALDPMRDEKAGPIARWSYTESEVAEFFQHKGTSQGIHLSLRWQEQSPTTDRVVLYVRYVFPDGRQIVNDREITLHQRDSLRSVWTPRVSHR